MREIMPIDTKEKEEITGLMTGLTFTYLTIEEANKLKDYLLLKYLEIIQKPGCTYTLNLFNAYLDDCGLDDLPRFHYRNHDPRKYLKNGEINDNYDKPYWRVM